MPFMRSASVCRRPRFFNTRKSRRRNRRSCKANGILSMERLEFRRLLAGDVAIHGYKWEDLNGDGRREAGEPGLAGVTIYVDSNLNNKFDADEPNSLTMRDDPNTRVDEEGLYWIQEVDSGLTLVREVVPGDYRQTFPDVLTCRAIYCVGRAHILSPEAGDEIHRVDFGNQPADDVGTIHGVKWSDEDGNGRRDQDEPGLPGVTIYIDVNLNSTLR